MLPLSHRAHTPKQTLFGEEGWSVSLWWIPALESKVRFLLSISNEQLWHSCCCSAQQCVGPVLPCHRKAQGNSITISHPHSLQGSEGMPLLHFLLFVQLKPTLPTLNNNTSSYLWFVQYVRSSRTKQTAAFPKTEIVFKKFRLASCLESPSWECCLQNPHLMLLHGLCIAQQSVHLSAWHVASS